MKILNLKQIKACLDIDAAVEAIEQGYTAYSEKRATVPPVGHLGFTDPAGDCHIKYGYIQGDEIFVIKVAYGFYGNQAAGLPGSDAPSSPDETVRPCLFHSLVLQTLPLTL